MSGAGRVTGQGNRSAPSKRLRRPPLLSSDLADFGFEFAHVTIAQRLAHFHIMSSASDRGPRSGARVSRGMAFALRLQNGSAGDIR